MCSRCTFIPAISHALHHSYESMEKSELSACACRVEANIAAGTYELHPTLEEEPAAELHHAKVEPELDQDPEDPLTFPEPEGKPRCMLPYFKFMQYVDAYDCAFTFVGVD